MMAKVAEKYEVLYIIDLDKGEEEIAAIVEKFKALIEANGTLAEHEEWGKRRLAYPINDKNEGYYVVATFNAPQAFPAELDRVFGITEGIMRFMTVVTEPKEAEAITYEPKAFAAAPSAAEEAPAAAPEAAPAAEEASATEEAPAATEAE